MRLIQPCEIWEHVRLPKLPDGSVSVEDLSEQENRLLNAGLQVLHLVEKENGQRRSINGLNRIAQNRYPEMSWQIDEVLRVADAWKIAGLPSLIDAIRVARELPPRCGRIASIRPKLSESAAVEIGESEVMEAFVSTYSWVKARKIEQPGWQLYRVAAKTNYGTYMFATLSIEPPSPFAVEGLCIAHNVKS